MKQQQQQQQQDEDKRKTKRLALGACPEVVSAGYTREA